MACLRKAPAVGVAPAIPDARKILSRALEEPERRKALEHIAQWTNPGPGGFYDDPGDITRQPHLMRGPRFNEDPGCYESSRVGFEEGRHAENPRQPPSSSRRVSWLNHAETLYDTPLEVMYSDLDPKARYEVRVLYGGDSPERMIRLVANGTIEVHPYLVRPQPFMPIEFELPETATRPAKLTLSWCGEPGRGGTDEAAKSRRSGC
jgi:hypothetical protein